MSSLFSDRLWHFTILHLLILESCFCPADFRFWRNYFWVHISRCPCLPSHSHLWGAESLFSKLRQETLEGGWIFEIISVLSSAISTSIDFLSLSIISVTILAFLNVPLVNARLSIIGWLSWLMEMALRPNQVFSWFSRKWLKKKINYSALHLEQTFCWLLFLTYKTTVYWLKGQTHKVLQLLCSFG